MYKLSVNGGLIDFIGDPKIILMASDPLEFSFGKAHKTYSITIPYTANNNKLIANNNKVDAILIVGDISFSGILYIDGVEDDNISAQFVSSVGKVWDDLRGKKLGELDWSEYNHSLIKPILDTYDTASRNFVTYDLSDRGIRLKPIEEGNTINDWITYYRYWDIVERFPAFNLRLMLDKIFAGYDIVDNLPDEFSDYYLLYTGTYDKRNSSEWMGLSEFTSENISFVVNKAIATAIHSLNLSGAIQNFNPIKNEGGYIEIPTYDKWTVPETGTYRVDGTLDIDIGISDAAGGVFTNLTNGQCVLSITKDPAPGIPLGALNIIHHTFNFAIATAAANVTSTKYLDTRYMEFTAGEKIYMKYAVTGTTTTTDPAGLPATSQLGFSTNCTFNITPLRWYGVGSNVPISDLMPDIDVLEFLRGICLFFNIDVYYKDVTKEVYLWQYSPDTIIDWTSKVIRNKSISTEIRESTKYTFKFKEEEDAAIDTPDSYTIDAEGEEQDITMMFTETGSLTSSGIQNGIPAIFRGNKKEESNSILQWYEFKADAGLKIAKKVPLTSYDNKGATSWINTYGNIGGTAGSVKQTRATFPGFFSEEFNLENTVNLYHRKTIESINNGEVLTCTLLMNSSDILSLINLTDGRDWRSMIHIDGANYRLLELEQLEGNIYKGRFLQIF